MSVPLFLERTDKRKTQQEGGWHQISWAGDVHKIKGEKEDSEMITRICLSLLLSTRK